MNKWFVLLLLLISFNAWGQVSFSDQTSTLGFQPSSSFYPVAIADLNGDFLDDVVYLDSGRYMWTAIQNPGLPFIQTSFGEISGSYEWSICIGDLNYDYLNDIVVAGYEDSIKIFKTTGAFGNYDRDTIALAFFIQGSNIVDIDNDGWNDIFACNDLGMNYPFRNYNSGSFVMDTSLIATKVDAGNYASIWSDHDNDGDLDLYISKCFSGATVTDPRRINLLYENDGNNNFTEVGVSAGVADSTQSWAAEWGDLDNDGDMDLFVLNHGPSNKLYENLGDGTYTNIYDSSGFQWFGADNYQVNFSDFDNDGYLDILIAGDAGALYLNNGDLTFTKVLSPFPGISGVSSCAVGDLNHDGFRDVYGILSLGMLGGVFTQEDKVFINVGNSNNFLVVNLVGTISNSNGIGARLELYGPWGIQIRDVRSGESYGIMNSLSRHFGLGQSTQIDSLIVKWPSGLRQKVDNPQSNNFITVFEGQTVAIKERMEKTAKVYPNPASERLEVSFLQGSNWSFQLMDVQGRTVLKVVEISQNSAFIDVSSLSPGFYSYLISNSRSTQATGKLRRCTLT